MTNQINALRKGMSYAAIAEACGLTASYICALAKDRRKNPSLETMQKIAAALNEDVTRVFPVNISREAKPMPKLTIEFEDGKIKQTLFFRGCEFTCTLGTWRANGRTSDKPSLAKQVSEVFADDSDIEEIVDLVWDLDLDNDEDEIENALEDLEQYELEVL